jgi:ribosome-binding protein aMBF1 (putative translation factor)
MTSPVIDAATLPTVAAAARTMPRDRHARLVDQVHRRLVRELGKRYALWLVIAREEAGLGVRHLAEIADVPSSTISRVERGERGTSYGTHWRIVAALSQGRA